MPVVKQQESYTVRCKHKDTDIVHEAIFTDLSDAQLWWDTIVYVRSVYQCPMTPRPGYKPDAQLTEFET